MSLFWDLAKSEKLGKGEVEEVARMLNNATRLKNSLDTSAAASEALQQYVDDFTRLYVNGQLPCQEKVPLHLISMYENLQQYQKCLDISTWVLQQDADQISPIVVGTIIKTIAQHDDNSQRYEELYRDALQYIPQTFDPYDISHGAILPNRSKHVNVQGATHILKNILHARLFHGKWREAYLTLDTALRIFVYDIEPIFLHKFVKFRPLHESYQVFMMFARSGAIIRPRDLMQLLAKLNSAQKVGEHLDLNIDLARAMFHLLQAYLASERKIDVRHLDHLIKGTLSLLDRCPSTISREAKILHDLEYQIVLKLLKQLFEFFTRKGCPPGESTYTTLINMSRHLRRSAVLSLALRGFDKAGLSMNTITWESLLAAAGDLQRPDLVRAVWTELCQHAVMHNYDLELRSWRVLAGSARETGLRNYVLDQVDLFHDKMDGYMYKEILKALRERPPWKDKYTSITTTIPLDVRRQHMRSIRDFSKDMGVLLSTIEKRPIRRRSDISQTSIWESPNNPNEQWQRELYDEISLGLPTNNRSAPGTPRATWSNNERINSTKSTESPTGFSLSQLRYKNTKSINNSLLQVEVWESKKNQSQSSAEIRENLEVHERGQDMNFSCWRPTHRKQIIAHRIDLAEEGSKNMTKEHWRARILNLRSRDYRLPPSLR